MQGPQGGALRTEGMPTLKVRERRTSGVGGPAVGDLRWFVSARVKIKVVQAPETSETRREGAGMVWDSLFAIELYSFIARHVVGFHFWFHFWH